MSRRTGILIVSFSALLVIAVALWWWSLPGEEPSETTLVKPEPLQPQGEVEVLAVDLYFPGWGGRLYRERREVPLVEDLSEQVQIIVEALLAGPQTAGLRAPLPADVEVEVVGLFGEGTVYIDLRSVDGSAAPPSGSHREMEMVYSLVDSVALNLPDVQRVALLWNGRQPATFAGHLDTSRPLRPKTDLVARLR